MIDPATAAAALILLASGPESAPVLSISTEVSTELPPELQPPVLDCVVWPNDKGRHRHRQRPHHRHHGWRFDDQP